MICSITWCYHLPSCNASTWPTLFPQYCNGSRQSPINIVSASATPNDNLTSFTFVKYDDTSAMTSIENTGETVKVTLKSGVKISGGDLSEQYDSLQFHFHWGNGSSVPGSEHTVDGKRYPMEVHFFFFLPVNDSTGLAALGFFIEVMSGNSTGQPESWRNLTSYLANITEKAGFSLDDLLVGVDRTKYYRYLGSLTTPACNEAVVWTVFKDPIKVSKDLIDLFSTTVRVENSMSELVTNVYRSLQPAHLLLLSLRTSSTTLPINQLPHFGTCVLSPFN
uniref:Alpha-carbonic anhydrase domain-containing protein n=1 Tax=Oreochromis aureus TaxID=47969 RepID=A0A668TNW7_OREAU